VDDNLLGSLCNGLFASNSLGLDGLMFTHN